MSKRLRNWLIGVPLTYLLVVCAFEGMAVYFGAEQAREGVARDEP